MPDIRNYLKSIDSKILNGSKLAEVLSQWYYEDFSQWPAGIQAQHQAIKSSVDAVSVAVQQKSVVSPADLTSLADGYLSSGGSTVAAILEGIRGDTGSMSESLTGSVQPDVSSIAGSAQDASQGVSDAKGTLGQIYDLMEGWDFGQGGSDAATSDDLDAFGGKYLKGGDDTAGAILSDIREDVGSVLQWLKDNGAAASGLTPDDLESFGSKFIADLSRESRLGKSLASISDSWEQFSEDYGAVREAVSGIYDWLRSYEAAAALTADDLDEFGRKYLGTDSMQLLKDIYSELIDVKDDSDDLVGYAKEIAGKDLAVTVEQPALSGQSALDWLKAFVDAFGSGADLVNGIGQVARSQAEGLASVFSNVMPFAAIVFVVDMFRLFQADAQMPSGTLQMAYGAGKVVSVDWDLSGFSGIRTVTQFASIVGVVLLLAFNTKRFLYWVGD